MNNMTDWASLLREPGAGKQWLVAGFLEYSLSQYLDWPDHHNLSRSFKITAVVGKGVGRRAFYRGRVRRVREIAERESQQREQSQGEDQTRGSITRTRLDTMH